MDRVEEGGLGCIRKSLELKQEIQAPEIPEESPAIAVQVTDLQNAIQTAGRVGEQIDLTGMEDEEEEELMEGEEPLAGLKRPRKSQRQFRGATSPTKVAQQHLKAKPDKEGKNREEK
eukprot:s1607_g9.t1